MKKILRPLPPHLTLFMSQLTSTFPISHRISGAFLATMVLFSPILCPKMGLISLTHQNFYQSSPNSSKFLPILVGLTAFALVYHLFHGVRHLVKYVRQKMFDWECVLYFTIATSRLARIALFLLIISFLLLLIFRTGYTLVALCLKAFTIPLTYAFLEAVTSPYANPLLLNNLELFLDPEDPEWVRYVCNELNESTGPEDFEDRARSLIRIEQASTIRRHIPLLVRMYSFQSGGYRIPEDIMDLTVREIFEKENIEFDLDKLKEIYSDLLIHRAESPFFQRVWAENGDNLRQMHRLEMRRLGL